MAENPRESAPPPTSGAPRIEELVVRTQAFITQAITDTVRAPIDEVGRHVAKRLTSFALGLVLVLLSTGFLLFGFMQLLAQFMTMHIACLVVGTVALLTGVIMLRSNGD